jgi:desulfoferrodoxin (superoxide reductase-like protein)
MSGFILPIYGDVPSVLEISVVEDETQINLEVRHGSPSSAHYVDIIEVKIGDETHKIILEPQSSVTFSEKIVIDKLDVDEFDVRAHCNIHGWSKWKTFKSETEVEDSSNGIPGFPIFSILIGFMIVAIIQNMRTK